MTDQTAYGRDQGEGWISFAGIMIIVLGVLNLIWGIAAIGRSSFFVADTKIVFDDVRTWGWIMLIVGIVQLLVGFGIFARNQAARWAGVAIAGLNLIAALASIRAYPFWALVVIGIDVLVIYGLTAYGARLEAR
ncbi:MAG TPA: hypothetical protein VLB47_12415 [Solirubrobacteraceae bacterium]|nr:hypothetical protein [Solirubrobacteraceae bacterium]